MQVPIVDLVADIGVVELLLPHHHKLHCAHVLQQVHSPEVGVVVVADGDELVQEHGEVGEVLVCDEAGVESVAEGEVVAVEEPVQGAALVELEGLLNHDLNISGDIIR